MNHIIIIGNGFDLAHGLKTSYMDFLTWYLKSIAEKIEKEKKFEDGNVKISFEMKTHIQNDINKISPPPIFKTGSLSKSPLTLLDNLIGLNFNVEYKSSLISTLLGNIKETTWVDIENQYYSLVKKIFKSQIESDSIQTPISLKKLNNTFDQIILLLEEYLFSEIHIDKIILKQDIINHIDNIKSLLIRHAKENILYLNFNYTNTINRYVTDSDLAKNTTIKHIHGKLKETNNPIIFGYGDETDKYYDDIERLNDNEYLKFMKSFGYAKSSNYQEVMNFLSSSFYEVHIMGHSCGLSDRVLLKSIFENKNCKKINILYYEKNENENDYMTKYMDISRHFSLDKKEIMREKITTKNQSLPLVKYKK